MTVMQIKYRPEVLHTLLTEANERRFELARQVGWFSRSCELALADLKDGNTARAILRLQLALSLENEK